MATQSKYLSKLADKRVLILGGTSGIGYAVAEGALEHGAHVTISGSNAAKLDKTVTRLREAYPSQTAKQSITTHVCDLSDTANLDANLKALFEKATAGGTTKLNHIVTTAGDALQIQPLSEMTPEGIYAAGTVRIVAPMMVAKYIPQYVEQSPASSFTLTNGARGHKPAPGWAVISAWATAGEGLVRGLGLDLKPVRVNIVSPGAVETELFSHFGSEAEQIREHFRKNSTTGTIGRPEDLAESYLYLMKTEFATGSVVDVNGGTYLV
ncbi:hypothetical protein NUU61_002717 [Penicillium alfredii]|uniref:NAD(P)-binding protein n=1 Tax=Penicillium alfredii TaxID=1506179 RepID=A0A9W9FS45_9EURO|nr:uncharacterized protein NUU61_002717 [Penicillium alfredii]KAJ5105370.1 hypothetical protein NUU61_002717 [Penicillium alfredii]